MRHETMLKNGCAAPVKNGMLPKYSFCCFFAGIARLGNPIAARLGNAPYFPLSLTETHESAAKLWQSRKA
jgi:hypothetical protein